MSRARNIETVLVGRFFMGASGSIGATLVGGTISDIYHPEEFVWVTLRYCTS